MIKPICSTRCRWGVLCFVFFFCFFCFFGLPVAGGCVLLRHRFDHVTEIAKMNET